MAAATTPFPAPNAVSTALRVLVADDDDSIRHSLRRLLSGAGYALTIVENGQEALDSFTSATFDLVVADITMPRLDGVGLLRALRQRGLATPVLLMTGHPDVDTAMSAIALGAAGYLRKPFVPDELLAEVEKSLRIARLDQLRAEAVRHGASAIGTGSAEQTFERALDKLFIVTQPIVSWSARSAFGYEALMRSGEPALARPLDLLDAAERLGRLPELSRCARERAALGIKDAPPGALLFVNLHPDDLLDEVLFDGATALSKAAPRIVLELTERARLELIENARGRVDRLRTLGFRIAIDDLGAGYGGLTAFALIEPEIVKLDMTLVRDIDKSEVRRAVIGSMMTLCRQMGAQIIAEGVETAAERDTLIALGCDLLQGYHFARPGPSYPAPVFTGGG